MNTYLLDTYMLNIRDLLLFKECYSYNNYIYNVKIDKSGKLNTKYTYTYSYIY